MKIVINFYFADHSLVGLGEKFWGADSVQVWPYSALPHSKIGAINKLAVFSINNLASCLFCLPSW